MKKVTGYELIPGKHYYLDGSPECILKFIQLRHGHGHGHSAAYFKYFSGGHIFVTNVGSDLIGFALFERTRFVQVNMFKYGK
jgi:hypothetical protein